MALLLCWCEPIIVFENPSGSFGGFAVVLVQANNCNFVKSLRRFWWPC